MFVYVFSEQDKERLISDGFVLVKEDKRNEMFVFALDKDIDISTDARLFALNTYCLSDVLTF